MTKELGLRARKKLERRQRIENAAIELFQAHGFDGTTVEEIADQAGIAPRTFFYYFPTKEDVVLADYSGRLTRIIEVLNSRPMSEPPWVALRAAFVSVADDYEARQNALMVRFTIIAQTPSVYARSLQLQAGWEDSLAEALIKRAGNGSNQLEPTLLASAALACMRSSLRLWPATSPATPLPEIVQNCFNQLAIGLEKIQ